MLAELRILKEGLVAIDHRTTVILSGWTQYALGHTDHMFFEKVLFVHGDKIQIMGLNIFWIVLDVQQLFVIVYLQFNQEIRALLVSMGTIWSEFEADLPFLFLEVGFLLLDFSQKHVFDMRF